MISIYHVDLTWGKSEIMGECLTREHRFVVRAAATYVMVEQGHVEVDVVASDARGLKSDRRDQRWNG